MRAVRNAFSKSAWSKGRDGGAASTMLVVLVMLRLGAVVAVVRLSRIQYPIIGSPVQ